VSRPGARFDTPWQRRGGRVTTPANAAQVRILLLNHLNSGWIAFDDVELTNVTGDTYNLTYDAENRLIQVEKSGNLIAEYVYDGDGLQVMEILQDGTQFVRPNQYYEEEIQPGVDNITMDNADSNGVTITGSWTASTSVSGYYGSNYIYSAASSTNNVQYNPTIPTAGRYQVYLRWTSATNRATNVPIDVHHAGSTTSLTVDQTSNGGQWNLLGTYDFDAGTTGYVKVRAVGADGVVVADAVRFVLVAEDLVVMDNADSTGVTVTGSWTASTSVSGYYGSNYIYSGASSTNNVQFNPTIPTAGKYLVYLRWTSHSNRATNVPIDVYHADGTTSLTVDQTSNGGQWNLLGTYDFDVGTAGYVKVRAAGADGYVVADAVRFVRTGTVSSTQYYFAGAARIAMRQNGELFYLLTDHLGSTSLVTDENGQNPKYQYYKPWGEVRYTSGTMPTDYTYTGQRSEMDSIGLMYYNARWYDPQLGRFTSPDTIVPDPGNPMAFDRYAYVYNNPINYTDPSGHNPECGPDGIWCSDNFEDAYGINFSDGWTNKYKAYVRVGVKAVAMKLASVLGFENPAMAFSLVYGIVGEKRFTFELGDCPKCKGAGANTHGSRHVEYDTEEPFYPISGNRTPYQVFSMNVHQVVHELGHAFSHRFKGESPIHPYTMVDKAKFSDTISFLTDKGYAEPPSSSVTGYWRANYSTQKHETFANMFVGWVYGAWANDGKIYGPERSDYMTTNMAETWLPALVGP
jgi:RHS repeat-associated protein